MNFVILKSVAADERLQECLDWCNVHAPGTHSVGCYNEETYAFKFNSAEDAIAFKLIFL